MTAPPVEVTVRWTEGGVTIAAPPAGADISVRGERDHDRIRVSLRGHGAFALRFEGMRVRDVEVRGGFIFLEPGTPFIVRGMVEGWLSVAARLAR